MVRKHEISLDDIKDHETKEFIQSIDLIDKPKYEILAVVCSDARKSEIRKALTKLGNVKHISSAGNAITQDYGLPTIIIGHGIEDETCCGARDHVRGLKKKEDSPLPSVVEYVAADHLENAEAQLARVREELRAGILYFNQGTGKIHKHKVHNPKVVEPVYQSLEKHLKKAYTQEKLESMRKGQDPKILFLNGINTNAVGDVFWVDMQKNRISGLPHNSIAYAVTHALKGHGSFKNSGTVIIAYDKNKVPADLEEFLQKEPFIHDYRQRGGIVLTAELGPKGHKKIYMIKD